MVSLVRPHFVHRVNRDGTTDSICGACYVTVCTSLWESELEAAERAHACDPYLLGRWKQAADPGAPQSPQS